MNKIPSNIIHRAGRALPLGLLLTLAGCSNDWDAHYSPAGDEASSESVIALIKQTPSLSRFAQMIEIAGLEETLSATQTYTVWAPTDEALASVDLSDEAEVRRLVNNHIARHNIPSSTLPSKGVRMLNGKIGHFNGDTFGGVKIAKGDIRCGNGVLHILDGAIPYRYNIREYISTHPEYSLLSDFLSRFDEDKFDVENSEAIDVDENGNIVYDTVTIPYNALLQSRLYGIGSIETEDSVFTMLIPDNRAWTEAYDRISPYFKVYDADAAKADSITDIQTSLAIVSDLVFRGSLTNPSGRLTTTTGSIIPDIAPMFANTTAETASNGMIYLTSSLNLDPVATFNKEIEVEAEESDGRTVGQRTNVIAVIMGSDDDFYAETSGHSYLEVSPSAASATPSVSFKVPEVLSGKYDIYASFLPTESDGKGANHTRMAFTLTYVNPSNGRNTSVNFNDDDFLTSPDEPTVIKVASAFEFPVSDFTDRMWLLDPANETAARTPKTSIEVKPNVTTKEFNAGELIRRFNIDRIYLIPVTD